AFTDGVTTWVNGPEGVLDRPNDVRFAWEKESAASPPQPSTTAASAPVAAPQVFTPEVKPMDSESGGPGGTVKRLMSEVESDWGQIWGWRPSKPTTVYLFTGGYHMAAGLPGITGQSVSAEQSKDLAASAVAVNGVDVQTGGWAIVVNIAGGMGTADWETLTKGTLARQYAYIMERDSAGTAGPTWYREGLVRLCSEAKVPVDAAIQKELAAMYDLNRKGTLPTLRRLHQDWAGFVSIASSYNDAANGMSLVALRTLSNRLGKANMLELLRRVGRGEDFDGVLKAMTGYTIEQLDADLKTKL
ncbi:MAG TPA: hypothetical protein VHS28_08695, partial [Chloroflexota bacterium]|nr:hypothetical protein [Chloroflexota bacterium]